MYNYKNYYFYKGPSRAQIQAKYMHHPRYYFAYGSNLNLKQMETRCPTAELVGPAELDGFKLVFRGVLDIEKARSNSKVVGAIFKVKSQDIYKLDQYEGYPNLYTKESTIAKINGKNRKLFYYIMVNQQDVKPPSDYYYQACYQGYKDCGLDVARLRQALYNSNNQRNTDVVDCGAKWGIKTRSGIISIPKNNVDYKLDNNDDFNQDTLFDDLRPYGKRG